MIKIIPLNKTSRNFYLSNVRTYDLKKKIHQSNHESQQNCYIVSFCIFKKIGSVKLQFGSGINIFHYQIQMSKLIANEAKQIEILFFCFYCH